MLRIRLAVTAVILLALTACGADPDPGVEVSETPEMATPANMASHGLLLSQQGPVETPPAGAEPVPSEPVEGAVPVVIYLDPMCVPCAELVLETSGLLSERLNAGTITVEFHVVTLAGLDSANEGSSTRVANAFAAVVDEDPHLAHVFLLRWFMKQHSYDDVITAEDLIEFAAEQRLDSETLIDRIERGTFESFVGSASLWALSNPAPGTDANVDRIPTMIVDGDLYEHDSYDADHVAEFIDERL